MASGVKGVTQDETPTALEAAEKAMKIIHESLLLAPFLTCPPLETQTPEEVASPKRTSSLCLKVVAWLFKRSLQESVSGSVPATDSAARGSERGGVRARRPRRVDPVPEIAPWTRREEGGVR